MLQTFSLALLGTVTTSSHQIFPSTWAVLVVSRHELTPTCFCARLPQPTDLGGVCSGPKFKFVLKATI